VATVLEQHPDAKAVMMVYPTYWLVEMCKRSISGPVQHPLLGEAHGAHSLAFILTTHARFNELDLTVQSIHKVLEQ